MQNYLLIRSQRKTIALNINKEGDLVVKAPHNFSINNIEIVITKHKNWIKNKIQSVKIFNEELNNLKTSKQLKILGINYKIIYSKDFGIKIDKTNQIIYLHNSNEKKSLKKLYLELFENFAQKIINQIHELALKMNVEFTSIQFISSKRTWGSCNKNNEIKINKLIFILYKEEIDYLLIHELCHIKHFNHSKSFWDTVEKFCPDYKKYKKQLKLNSIYLTL